MKQLIRLIKKKWIDGECRHICVICPYYKRWCKNDYLVEFSFMRSKYAKGYSEGYEDGYNAAIKRIKK